MAKKLTIEDFVKIDTILHETRQQNRMLDEIQICLKGSEALGIEGVLAAQKRMSKEIEDMQTTLSKIEKAEAELRVYLGIIASKRLWRGLFLFLAGVVALFVGIKYGWEHFWRMVKSIF